MGCLLCYSFNVIIDGFLRLDDGLQPVDPDGTGNPDLDVNPCEGDHDKGRYYALSDRIVLDPQIKGVAKRHQ
jgi:hypothetical protein